MKKNVLFDELRSQIQANIDTTCELAKEYLQVIIKVGEKMAAAIKKGNKIFLCGNGGSAADSQHIAAEFINRFRKERRPLSAIALTTDTSVITSISNDYGYKYVFSKQISALGQNGDILVGISTSGNAGNVINAVKAAKNKGLFIIGLTGDGGGKLKEYVDLCIRVPSHDTPRIQEAHILIGHLLCDIIEKSVFK
jgi:D-sedoheptulose 7-phosphate isomerase